MKPNEKQVGKTVALALAALLPTAALALGIAAYLPHRDLYQRATVIITIGALAGLCKWFIIRVKTNHVTKSDIVIFSLLTVYLLYVGYCQITLPLCIECDKPTFLNKWIWKVLGG
ncbi:MAG: hypothetical protein IJR90_07100 [Clostridia bacterium]|nr:hypothetical protein [Clostridia bacterium]